MQAEAFVIEMVLRSGYTASGHSLGSRPGVIVKLTDGDLTGWGEFVEVPGYSSETVETALASMHGAPVTHVNPGAVAAVRSAELDLEARREAVPLVHLLGGEPGRVSAGAVIGRFGDEVGVLEEAEARLAEGYQKLKVKIGPGFDVEPLQAVMQQFPEAQVAADANGSYQPGELPAGLDSLGLLYLEQPYAPQVPWSEFAALRALTTTPLGLDESITGLPTLRSAIASEACDLVVLKPARVAGLAAAVAMHDLAVATGLDLVAGGLLETGIGRAGTASLARLPGFNIPADLSASDRYWQEDLTEPWVLTDGSLDVSDRPGIGVKVDEERLEAVTVAHHRLDDLRR